MMKNKISPRHIFPTLFCLATLVGSACNVIGQDLPITSLPTPTAVSQAVDLTSAAKLPAEVTFEASATSPTGATAVMSTRAPTATDVPATVVTLVQPTEDPFIAAELKNATYTIKDFATVNGGSDTVTLVDGKYAYVDPTNPPDPANYTVEYWKSSVGDLNGDGVLDAAAILIADTSGSGTFIYLAAMVGSNGTLENTDTIFLGDRVVVEAIAIQDGMINLQMIVHGPQDGLCCPSVKTTRTYLLENGRLVTQVEKTARPLAEEVIQALKAEDMAKLSEFVDSSSGVRFSPYTNVKETDLVFTPDRLANAFNDPAEFLWGNYEGSGAPIQLTFAGYYALFVYNQDFASATDVGYNQSLSSANVTDNSYDFYPNSIIVEFFLPGTNPDYGAGLDWQSLKLVFQQVPAGGKWYLVGIIHSQWTI